LSSDVFGTLLLLLPTLHEFRSKPVDKARGKSVQKDQYPGRRIDKDLCFWTLSTLENCLSDLMCRLHNAQRDARAVTLVLGYSKEVSGSADRHHQTDIDAASSQLSS